MKLLLRILLVALLLSPVWPAGAETFLVLGRAPLGGNAAQAKEQAVADALTRAVAQAAAVNLGPATLRDNLATLEQKVLRDAQSYVSNFSLVASTATKGEFLALVSVGIDERALSKSLIQATLKLPTTHLGPILVMVSEETAPGRPPVYWWSGLPGAPDAPAPVAKVLKKMGARTINPNQVKPTLNPGLNQAVLSESQALEVGRQAGAQVVLLGSVRTFPLVTPDKVTPPPLAQLLALDTKTGQVAAMEETDSPVYHATPTAEDAQKVLDLVEGAVRKLMAGLAANLTETAPVAQEVALQVTGVRSLAQLVRLEKALLAQNDLVERAWPTSAGAGQALFRLKLKGSPSQLADRLMVQDYGDFLVNVVEGDATGLKVVIIPRQPGAAPAPRPQTAPAGAGAATGPEAPPSAAPAAAPAPQPTGAGQ